MVWYILSCGFYDSICGTTADETDDKINDIFRSIMGLGDYENCVDSTQTVS
jgi:hypothetical protein